MEQIARHASSPQVTALMRPSLPGASQPLGATPADDGVNFSVFSPHATQVELMLFAGIADAQPTESGPRVNRTFGSVSTVVRWRELAVRDPRDRSCG